MPKSCESSLCMIFSTNFSNTRYIFCSTFLTIFGAWCFCFHLLKVSHNQRVSFIFLRCNMYPHLTDHTARNLCCRYIQLLWSLEIAETHHDRAFGKCFTDLQVKVLWP
jgi:hypothetical protein